MVSIIFTVHIHVSSKLENLRFLQFTHPLQKRHIASEGLFFPGWTQKKSLYSAFKNS